MTYKKWAVKTISLSLVLLLILGGITFAVDPLYQYRYDENDSYFLSSKFSCAGLIKNYEYDSVMLGSSMTQNFDPDIFKDEMGLNLLKVNVGGMSVPELCVYLDYIDEHSDCKKVFVSLDLQRFAINPDEAEFKIPKHLINGYWDDYKYLLSSEVYTRFLPLDLAIKGLETLNIEVPSFIKNTTDIDELGSWYRDYPSGEEAVLKSLEKDGFGVSSIVAEDVDENAKENIELLFSTIEKVSDETEYVFFFPPYSSLYWFHSRDNGHFDAFCEAKESIFNLSKNYKNITVYDFQNFDLTADLNNYRDITHYSKDINDYMVKCFADGTGLVTSVDTLKANKNGMAAKADNIYTRYKYHIDTYCKTEK